MHLIWLREHNGEEPNWILKSVLIQVHAALLFYRLSNQSILEWEKQKFTSLRASIFAEQIAAVSVEPSFPWYLEEAYWYSTENLKN
jgi:hypothetical protein